MSVCDDLVINSDGRLGRPVVPFAITFIKTDAEERLPFLPGLLLGPLTCEPLQSLSLNTRAGVCGCGSSEPPLAAKHKKNIL